MRRLCCMYCSVMYVSNIPTISSYSYECGVCVNVYNLWLCMLHESFEPSFISLLKKVLFLIRILIISLVIYVCAILMIISWSERKHHIRKLYLFCFRIWEHLVMLMGQVEGGRKARGKEQRQRNSKMRMVIKLRKLNQVISFLIPYNH